MTHNLKIQQEYLENLISGVKRVEIRYNDRDYQRGDVLHFRNHRAKDPSKRVEEFLVTHIHSGLGMAENYVALSVERIV